MEDGDGGDLSDGSGDDGDSGDGDGMEEGDGGDSGDGDGMEEGDGGDLGDGSGDGDGMEGGDGDGVVVVEEGDGPDGSGGGPTVHGQVVDPSGGAVGGGISVVGSGVGTVVTTLTDDEGRYVLSGLPPGPVSVFVRGNGLVAVDPSVVELVPEGVGADVGVTDAGSIAGQVNAPEGWLTEEPRAVTVVPADEATQARFPPSVDGAPGLPSWTRPIGADGSFLIGDLPGGVFQLLVDGAEPVTVEAPVGKLTPVEIDVTEVCAVEVHGKGIPPGLLVRAKVHWESPGSPRAAPWPQGALKNGKARIEGCASGAVTAALEASEDLPNGVRWVLERGAEAQPGTPAQVEFAWPAEGEGGAIRGQVTREGPGGPQLVVHALGQGVRASAPVADDGSYRIHSLPPGTYRVVVAKKNAEPAAEGGAEALVEAGAEAEVALTAE
jgi:hypothetical protein